MERYCQYCDEKIAGAAYHVTTSEDDGVLLIDMVVCAACASVAKRLKLHTQKVTPELVEAAVPVQRYLI